MKYPWAILILLLFLGVGCTDSPSNEAKPTIKLAANDWIASELNAYVAAILIEQELGYPAEVIHIDESEQWELIANGELHANLEIWATGYSNDEIITFIDSNRIENGGELGVTGKIGWYVPSYILVDYPELITWEGLAAHTDLFVTDQTAPHGQFLAGDPTWAQYDADIINGLGMDFEVIQTGGEEALLQALDTAYTQREPILLYFWTPHWAYIVYDLVEVALPPYTEECYRNSPIVCDYPMDSLFKILSPTLSDVAPEVYTFLRNFNYTNRDQIAMMAFVQVDGMTVEEAANTWVNDHEEKWQSWLP